MGIGAVNAAAHPANAATMAVFFIIVSYVVPTCFNVVQIGIFAYMCPVNQFTSRMTASERNDSK